MKTIAQVLRNFSLADYARIAERNERAAKAAALDRTIASGSRPVDEATMCRRMGRPEYMFVKNAERKEKMYRKHIAFEGKLLILRQEAAGRLQEKEARLIRSLSIISSSVI